MCILLPTTRSIRAQTQTMQTMSPCSLLWKRMSSETLEGQDKWTQEEMQQINKNKNNVKVKVKDKKYKS